MSKDTKVKVEEELKPAKVEKPVEVVSEKPAVPEETPVEDPKEPEYVHVPGTVHINAYYGAVEEAKLKVSQAKSELAAAEQALEDKKQSSVV